jgi:hypothetical protein
MSLQSNEGWFPECLMCGCGNLSAVVCLDPTCHEAAAGSIVPSNADSVLYSRDGHYWKDCYFCSKLIRSDGGSFGTYALCADCWNACAKRKEIPPSSPRSRAAP